jgi:hypothetical protein
MDPSSIAALERNLKTMGGKPVGEDAENIIWQLPNGMRWPVEKMDKGLVLSKEQATGKKPLPPKQLLALPEPTHSVALVKAPVPEREEPMVQKEVTASSLLNQMVPINRRRGDCKRRADCKTQKGHSLSPEFVREADRIFKEKGRAAAQEFIRSKRDLWSAR